MFKKFGFLGVLADWVGTKNLSTGGSTVGYLAKISSSSCNGWTVEIAGMKIVETGPHPLVAG